MYDRAASHGTRTTSARYLANLVVRRGLPLNDNTLPAREPAGGMKFRDRARLERRLTVFPEAAEGALFTRFVEMLQVCPIAGRKVRHPLIQVVHSYVVEQLKAVGAGLTFVRL